MKTTIDLQLTGPQIYDLLEEYIVAVGGFDEFHKRVGLIRVVCENSTYDEHDIDAMKKLFNEIIDHEERRLDTLNQTPTPSEPVK